MIPALQTIINETFINHNGALLEKKADGYYSSNGLFRGKTLDEAKESVDASLRYWKIFQNAQKENSICEGQAAAQLVGIDERNCGYEL